MKALVIYESVFGNTKQIATAVGEGIASLATAADVQVIEVGMAPTENLDEYQLLVFGGPVHAFGMSRAIGRRDAVKNLNRTSITGDRGLREWFKDIEHIGKVPANAFDTRVDKIFGVLPVGFARRGIANRFKKRGCRIIDGGEGFFVRAVEGPLEDGELERARAWGRTLTDKAARSTDFRAA